MYHVLTSPAICSQLFLCRLTALDYVRVLGLTALPNTKRSLVLTVKYPIACAWPVLHGYLYFYVLRSLGTKLCVTLSAAI